MVKEIIYLTLTSEKKYIEQMLFSTVPFCEHDHIEVESNRLK